uniref:Helicase C-terminal domain-containing protein n=1 Tax=Anopheles maculatus TaxID=74869 RepID=A0A182S6E7_9DIPT
VDGIKVVINYDYPQQTEDYVHRIGRTGRSNATGEAYTFFTFAERKMAKELIGILEEANQTVPPELLKWRNMFGGGGGNRFSRFGTFRGGNGGGYGGGGNRFGGGGGDYRNGGSSMGAKRPYDSSSHGGGGYGGSNSYSNGGYGAASSSSNGYDSRSTKHTRFDD